MAREMLIDGRTLALAAGDITTVPADAIVNAANAALAGGGGVDGAIHRAGGPEIMAELRERHRNGCPTGSAVLTGAGALPARFVIHAVGPVWHGGSAGEPEALAGAYRTAVRLADDAGARSITLPAISCGVYGYPLEHAALIALETVTTSLGESTSLQRATFVLRGDDTMRAFEDALDRVAAPALGT